MKNYYKILEIEPDATFDQIKSQHRFLVHAWHPDKFPNPEQKTKAEEKLKEINEAYSTLSDPEKRKMFDLYSGIDLGKSSERKTSNQDYQPSNYRSKEQPINNIYQNDRRNICESCGMPAETKYIEIYQNIGLLIMRRFGSVKGKFCKSCIEYHFWTMTGKTMLFGWWGFISFIITPFLIINNFLRYLTSIKLERSILSISPKPSPFWIFSSLGGMFLVVYLVSFMFGGNTITAGYGLTSTSTPRVAAHSNLNSNSSGTAMVSSFKSTDTPTKKPTLYKSSTPFKKNCYRWDEVTHSNVGKKICVYGKVYKGRYQVDTFQILFSEKANTFFLAVDSGDYFDVKSGECFYVEGIVKESYYGVPYIVPGEFIYYCESWMK